MKCRTVELSPRQTAAESGSAADLLEALERMVRRGHLPSSQLLVRLTDGRIRLNGLPKNREEALVCLRRIGNEYGPVRTALWISVQFDGSYVQIAVESLTAAFDAAAAKWPRHGIAGDAAFMATRGSVMP